MSSSLARALRFVCILSLFISFATTAARADLVWSAQTGWRIEGGVLSGLAGPESRNAVNLMNKARAAEEKGSVRSPMKAYEKVAKKYPNSVYAPEALYRAAKLRLKRKQYFKAFEHFQGVVIRYPSTSRFNEVIGEEYRIAAALLDGARNRIWGLIPSLTNREKSVEYFEVILGNAPYSDYAPLALMNIARAHQRFGQEEEAIDALDRMINNYPQSLLAPDAYIKLAQQHAALVDGPYYDQASTKQAITYFEDFMILFPGDENVGSAEKGLSSMKEVLARSKMKIADFYFYKRDNYKAARVFYNEAITVYPDSKVAAKAREELVKVDAAETKAATRQPKKKKRFWIF